MNQQDIVIDGSHGEGGGQILRTSLSLSALTARSVHFLNIRAGRPKPGLAAQHLTAVRAAAAICGAEVSGDHLGSLELSFRPNGKARGGDYSFDVAEARQGGSAGAASLVLQTVFVPLIFAPGRSSVLVRGGTHVPWSPTYDYVHDVWLWTLKKMGVEAETKLLRSGWYPRGGGEIYLAMTGQTHCLRGISLLERPQGVRLLARSVVVHLPKSISERMRERIRHRLQANGFDIEFELPELQALDRGAWAFLLCHYGRGEAELRSGFDAFGKLGKTAEAVADEVVDEFIRFQRSLATIDRYLGDQLILPAALAGEPSAYKTEITRHLLTQAWVVEAFGLAKVTIDGRPGTVGTVTIHPESRLRR